MTKLSPERSANKDTDQYIHEVRTWETDKVLEGEKSKRLAWRIATIAVILAMLSVAAVAMLTPLKTVEPYVIRVDNSTGIVDVVNTLKNGDTNYQESVNKYFTQVYVRAREGYNKELAETSYNTVGLMSGTVEQARYVEHFNPKNPLSPLNVYAQYAKVNISIKSTSFITPNVALVRYVKEIQRGPDRAELSHWAATVTFRYLGAPMTDKDRGVNPLGFQVTDYRTDPESLISVEQKNYRPTAPSPSPIPSPTPSAMPAFSEIEGSAGSSPGGTGTAQ